MDTAFAVILTSLAAGYLCARFGAIPRDAADSFNRFVIYFCLPSIVLRLIPRLAFDRSLVALVAVPWVLLGVGVVLVEVASRAFSFDRKVKGALLLCVPLGNTSFLGFPMIGALLGQESVRFAVIYDQLGSFLTLSTYGLIVVARYSGAGEPSSRDILLRVVRFPPFIALLAAFVPIPHPPVLDAVLGRIGDTLVPVAMFAVGLRLELRVPRKTAAFAFGLSTKMLVLPLLGFALARVLGAPEPVARVAALEAGMPPMITAGAFAIMAGLAPDLAAALVGYGILLSLVSLPAIASFVR